MSQPVSPARTVVIVVAHFRPGGAERQAVELAINLDRWGWRAVVVAVEPHGVLRQRLVENKVRIYDLDARLDAGKWHPRFWLSFIRSILRLRRICIDEEARAIQSFLFWQGMLAVPAALIAPGNPAVITGRRNMTCSLKRGPAYRLVEKWLNRNTDAVVCNSRAVARDTLRRERIDRRRIVVIPNGINPHLYAATGPADLSGLGGDWSDVPFIVGTVGNMKAQKRHDLFLGAMKCVRARVPGARGLIIGRDLGEKERLIRLRRDLELDDAVFLLENIDDAGPWYRRMDVMALCSDYEGMPNVVMEAMAAGTPVVATNAGGVRELIRHNQHGLVVPRGNAEALADAIVLVLRTPRKSRAMARCAKDWIESRYSSVAMSRRYARLYESLK